jgi:hypothetical protein
VGYKELLREIDDLAVALDRKHADTTSRYDRLQREALTLQGHLESLDQLRADLLAADSAAVHVA